MNKTVEIISKFVLSIFLILFLFSSNKIINTQTQYPEKTENQLIRIYLDFQNKNQNKVSPYLNIHEVSAAIVDSDKVPHLFSMSIKPQLCLTPGSVFMPIADGQISPGDIQGDIQDIIVNIYCSPPFFSRQSSYIDRGLSSIKSTKKLMKLGEIFSNKFDIDTIIFRLHPKIDSDAKNSKILSLVGVLDLKGQYPAVVQDKNKLSIDIPAIRLKRKTIYDYLIPEDDLLSLNTQYFPQNDMRIERAKVLDPRSLSIKEIIIDSKTGAQVSLDEIQKKIEKSWRKQYGSINYRLLNELKSKSKSDSVEAIVWIDVPSITPFLGKYENPDEYDKAYTHYLNQKIKQNKPYVSKVSQTLKRSGIKISFEKNDPPCIQIMASKDELCSKLAFMADIEEITGVYKLELDPNPPEKRLNSKSEFINLESSSNLRNSANDYHGLTPEAEDLIQDPFIFGHMLGLGRNLRIVVVEDDCINDDHKDFQFVRFENTLDYEGRCNDIDGTSGPHITRVASALASAQLRNPGRDDIFDFIGLFGGRIYEASSFLGENFLSRHPHFFNMSTTHNPAFQRSMDRMVFLDRIFIANGAGNSNSDEAITYAYSYNSLSVGGYDHNTTVGLGNFEDDISIGSWVNDPRYNREEPDLVGPYGVRVADPMFDYYNEYAAGTSFATPAVIGLAALITSHYPVLLGDPTLLRAVLMASASHPIANVDVQDAPPVPLFSDCIDDRSGVGAPRGDRAKKILEYENYYSNYLDRELDFNEFGYLINSPRVFAYAGETIRVVLTWDQCPDSKPPYLVTPLMVDLDLILGGPPLLKFENNVSNVDNYEVAQFVAPYRGQYIFNVHATNWDICETTGEKRTHVALAWDVFRNN